MVQIVTSLTKTLPAHEHMQGQVKVQKRTEQTTGNKEECTNAIKGPGNSITLESKYREAFMPCSVPLED
eukprot:1142741-Pelagomonas_calceolata.AAC.1